MAVVTTNLGVITAYGDAVAAGYTGTKAEWQALMANYATVGQQAAQDAQTASTAASTATTAAQTATTKASEASASAMAAEQAAASIGTPDTTLTQSGKAADAKATGDKISEIKEDFTAMVNSAYVTDSASGSVAHYVDGADDVPMKSVKVNIAPVQSGSGDPSPSNVRAISGLESVKVTRAGKNVFPSKGLTQTLNGITIHSNDDGSFTVNGTATANAQFDLTLNNELKLQSGQYTVGMFADKAVTFDNQHVWWFFYSMDAHADIVNCQTPSKTFSLNTVTATRFYLRIISGATVDNVTFYPMLVYGSDAPTVYEPYHGNTYDISLASAGTVYGGTLDVVSGELTVDRAIVDLGTLNWTYESTLPRFYTSGLANNIRLLASNDDVVDGVSSMYKVVSFNNLYVTGKQNGTMAVSTTKAVSVINTDYTDATSFKTAMSGQMFVYPLATPLTYQLSATEIKSLLGINNIWSDAGDVDVEYRADTKLYIDKRLAEALA